MVSYNRTILAGNLTRDPELTFTNNGIPVCNFGIAVNRRKRDGEDEAHFFDIKAWREMGENIANYKKKGDPILIEGRLEFRQWEAQDGSRRSKVDVVADNVQFLSRGSGGEDQDGSNEHSGQRAAAGAGSGGKGNDPNADDFDDSQFDDIPFMAIPTRRRVVADIL